MKEDINHNQTMTGIEKTKIISTQILNISVKIYKLVYLIMFNNKSTYLWPVQELLTFALLLFILSLVIDVASFNYLVSSHI